ncbi:MAG: hypothetical protein AAF533_22690 [Acidobacteriota bacterium]
MICDTCDFDVTAGTDADVDNCDDVVAGCDPDGGAGIQDCSMF